jgi:hypothetical protein
MWVKSPLSFDKLSEPWKAKGSFAVDQWNMFFLEGLTAEISGGTAICLRVLSVSSG